jgi:YD repeat-containing protein
MVAIVSGNTLGLNLTSKGVLGDQGVNGNPTQGQGGEQVYVNAATGNLVMQQLQDELVGAGLDVASVLTYNSMGLAGDDNGDNFSLGKVTVQLALSGTVNTAGSTLTRTAFDGSRSVYTWNATTSSYQCINGAGAFDSITYTATPSQYTWTDGSTQAKEIYDGATKRLLTRSDANGNTLTFGYDNNGQLTSVTDANGEVVTYVYSGNKLMAINAPVTNASTYAVTTQQVVSYAYDASNRLTSVTVDLSPDGSTADGNVYVTSFTYDGSSTRVQTMQQSDGTKLTFVYDASQRVYTITDALSNVTTFNYDTVNRKTSVTANGQTTVYGYDATTGLLTSVTAPAVNGISAVVKYVYNANGQLTSYVDGDNNTTTYGYDAAGNQNSVLDAAGNLTTRTYDAQNRLLTETKSTLARPTFVSSPNMAVSGGTATKTGSSTNWDAGVRSANGILGPATVSFVAGSPANHVMVGLNSDPDTDSSYASLDYALYLQSGTSQVYSNGSYVATIGSYVQGDNFSLCYDGAGHVNFLRNGGLLYSMAATVTQPLYVDTEVAAEIQTAG